MINGGAVIDAACSTAPNLDAAIGHVLTALNPLLTTIIAAAVCFVTYQQFRIAKQKLALDLFDKRMAVYNSLILAARRVYKAETRDDAIFEFGQSQRDARFLFGDEIASYLEETGKSMVELTCP